MSVAGMDVTPAIETSPEVGELAKALAAAQGKIAAAAKSTVNPHFGKTYADLASVWEACREPLTSNGLSVVQLPLADDKRIGVSTTLLHQSGQWMRSTLWLVPERPGPQAAGSCLTYARRYALSAVAGVAPDDDDGNGASADPKGGSAPAEKAKRADKVKAASDSVMATPDQVTLIHTLKGKIGGMTDDQYRRGLAAYKKADGSPCESSKDLTEQQANNLIVRLRDKVDRQEATAAKVPDLRPMNGGKGPSSNGVNMAAFSALNDDDLREFVLSPWAADTVDDLSQEDRLKASLLAIAYTKGEEAYRKQLRDLGFHSEPGERE